MWYYHNVPMTVVEFEAGDFEQVMAKLQPLGASTVYQFFGSTKPTITLKALVVGATDMVALTNLLDDATAYTLSGMYNSEPVYIGEYYPEKMTFRLLNIYKQTFRQDKAPYERVYEATITLARTT